jgi:hypothetical protein
MLSSVEVPHPDTIYAINARDHEQKVPHAAAEPFQKATRVAGSSTRP